MSQERLKIAVFVDFDNIEIGVKNTLNRNFDISAVLEAIKERGEIVTKVAYGDWKRSGDYNRQMGQHAVQLVQRNLTPGGDKNGADINLALDALEMAFTLNHINAFVIVGGDSDFMTLVEKLKLYDKTVIIVGGRGFTSTILQKNCHEFIAYENLIRGSGGGGSRRSSGRSQRSGSEAMGDKPPSQAVPLVRRALKVLSDREVSPQLGLLKSTLLQLDSTFSERDYGASTFRDFVEKLAKTGVVKLKQVDRSLLVELSGDESDDDSASDGDQASDAAGLGESKAGNGGDDKDAKVDSSSGRTEEGVNRIRSIFEGAKTPPKWPLYVRGVKQFIKSAEPGFDERSFGFNGFLDALRQTQKAGVIRMERNRQGVLRIYPGEALAAAPGADPDAQPEMDPRAIEINGPPSTAPEPGSDEEAALDEAAAIRAGQIVKDGEGSGDSKSSGARRTGKKSAKAGKKKTTKKTTKKATKKKTTKKTTRKTSKKPAAKAASDSEVSSEN